MGLFSTNCMIVIEMIIVMGVGYSVAWFMNQLPVWFDHFITYMARLKEQQSINCNHAVDQLSSKKNSTSTNTSNSWNASKSEDRTNVYEFNFIKISR